VMKLEGVWPLGWLLGVDGRGEVLEYSGNWCYSRFKMDYNTHEWSDFILMPRVGAMVMCEQRVKGAYMNRKHRVGEK